MSDRRSLVEGLKVKESESRSRKEEEFVFAGKPNSATSPEKAEPPVRQKTAATTPRVPLTTRIRPDLAAALKRASLERQLNGHSPHTLQDILEDALEPWLRSRGHLPGDAGEG